MTERGPSLLTPSADPSESTYLAERVLPSAFSISPARLIVCSRFVALTLSCSSVRSRDSLVESTSVTSARVTWPFERMRSRTASWSVPAVYADATSWPAPEAIHGSPPTISTSPRLSRAFSLLSGRYLFLARRSRSITVLMSRSERRSRTLP